MNSAKSVLPLARLCTRQVTQSAVRRSAVNEVPSNKFKKLKENQKKFQIDDGVPVYLKGGFTDRIFFQATAATTLVGLVMSLQVFYILANK
ncbi:hypothetical protein RN001_001657 [Aquatica leii]|uniref:Uncharacterized protein n=1 Tax=Aquatica leii TaxID=1421715 RepID=A0AAN7PLF8_9COLE|nr:hypothetical protein RN001_001657 [Aquatica leii]